MRIDWWTKTKDVLPLIDGERLEELLEKVQPYPLRKPILRMTVGEYIEALEPEFAVGLLKARKAFVAFGRLKQYRKEMQDIAAWMEAHAPQQTPSEKASMAGIDFPSPQESMLLECLHNFHCTGLDSLGRRARRRGMRGAADIPLAEYLILIKEKTAAAKYEKAVAAKMTAAAPKAKGGVR